jgi:hypothetical protein
LFRISLWSVQVNPDKASAKAEAAPLYKLVVGSANHSNRHAQRWAKEVFFNRPGKICVAHRRVRKPLSNPKR